MDGAALFRSAAAMLVASSAKRQLPLMNSKIPKSGAWASHPQTRTCGTQPVPDEQRASARHRQAGRPAIGERLGGSGSAGAAAASAARVDADARRLTPLRPLVRVPSLLPAAARGPCLWHARQPRQPLARRRKTRRAPSAPTSHRRRAGRPGRSRRRGGRVPPHSGVRRVLAGQQFERHAAVAMTGDQARTLPAPPT
jgi:hypothetical protein